MSCNSQNFCHPVFSTLPILHCLYDTATGNTHPVHFFSWSTEVLKEVTCHNDNKFISMSETSEINMKTSTRPRAQLLFASKWLARATKYI